jgi:hypothetical protein
MTPKQLDEALATIGWTNRRCAEQAACSEILVRNWLAGTTPIPPPVGQWLQKLAAAHRILAAPKGWRHADKLAERRRLAG